ncbi:GntR family transcriptional regulator [Marinomonas sp. 15G1-11]|uniref:GntR family transcriptional regulator n=1 Tax=Marinomonas phaeophyticola TaxID=3004091 RepID=A0ABT4JR76_9GAMM|nr:GntR family transcriptional regulator [Marinomonas sp. 15G1-11]MCZ2720876.1 GntR family transcriptional regulator [Marinomonas sp. 15G1-11]
MSTSKKSKTLTISEELVTSLSHSIIQGDLKQGSKIFETELAQKYGVSRGPLREAIVTLEGLGLVTRAANIGARVVELNTEDMIHTFSVRESLEGMAARLAVEHISDKELKELYELLDKHEDYLTSNNGNHYIHQEGNYDFHNRIIKASRNPKLISLLINELYSLIRMYRQQTSESRPEPKQALREHRNILDAIANKEADLAELLMRRHISRSRNVLEKALIKQTNSI